MMSTLAIGVKERLIGEFQVLKARKPGREWRALLKEYDEWHRSDEAGHIWRNAKRGIAGNDGFQKLVADMREILKHEEGQPNIPKVSKAEMIDARALAIAESLASLKRTRKRPKSKPAKN